MYISLLAAFTACNLYCSASFDHEEQPDYTFSLIVLDNGRTPRRSAPSSVTIAIGNINDEDPEFDQSTYSNWLI